MKDSDAMEFFKKCCTSSTEKKNICKSSPVDAKTGDRISHFALKTDDPDLLDLAFNGIGMSPQNRQVINNRPLLEQTEAMISAEKGERKYIDMLKGLGLSAEELKARSSKYDKTAYDFAVSANHPRLAEYIKSLESSLIAINVNSILRDSKEDEKYKVLDMVTDPKKILAVVEKINQSRTMTDWNNRG
jgi:hypothetical protein